MWGEKEKRQRRKKSDREKQKENKWMMEWDTRVFECVSHFSVYVTRSHIRFIFMVFYPLIFASHFFLLLFLSNVFFINKWWTIALEFMPDQQCCSLLLLYLLRWKLIANHFYGLNRNWKNEQIDVEIEAEVECLTSGSIKNRSLWSCEFLNLISLIQCDFFHSSILFM